MNALVEESFSNLHVSKDTPKLRLENQVEETTLVSSTEDDERRYENVDEKEVSDLDNDEARDTTLPSPGEPFPGESASNINVTEERGIENVIVEEPIHHQSINSEAKYVAASGAEDQDDASVYSYGTNGTSESSVYDIISRLHSETQRRRRRLIKRRSGREDSLQKYMSRASSDPMLGITLDISKIEE
jgi:hypothetical protein